MKIRRERGVSTLAAVMMIIIMGILGAAFVSLLGTENYGYLNHYEAAQSFYNANAGVEWGQKQKTSTISPIPFAGGTVSVNVVSGTIIATGTTDRGERVIQVQMAASPPITAPSAGCESFTISEYSSFTPYSTIFSNPISGLGDLVYIKVRSTAITACSGGAPTLNWARVYLNDLSCPSNSYIFDNLSSWSCAGPLTDASCTDYYEYTSSFRLPGSWSNTTATLKVDLKSASDNFFGNEVITIGQGECSSVRFYSDSGYTTEVDPWEFTKGNTYYLRVITNNLLGNAPTKKRLIIRDFYDNVIFQNADFFSLSGTQSITCGGNTYNYASYDGSFTVPDSVPSGGSAWNSEPVSDYYYNFSVELEKGGQGCPFNYENNLKFITGTTGAGSPLDEAASEATATQGSPGTPDWYGASGNNKKFIIKLFNKTDTDIVLSGFDISSTTSQTNLRQVYARTAANAWSKNRIWNGNQALPTGILNLNDGTVNDKVIAANSYIVIDGFLFQGSINPGTFTLIVYFQSGESSTLTFSLP